MTPEQLKQMVNSPMFKDMMGDEAENISKMMENKDTQKQMLGFWKQLDEMASTDKTSYDDFIKKQKGEWEENEKKKNAEREKQRIIMSTPLCAFKCKVCKILAK